MNFRAFLQRGLRNTIRDWRQRRREGDPEAEFCRFARQRWPHRRTEGPLLLMHQTTWYPSIVAYAFLGQVVGDELGARPASFHFSRKGDTGVTHLYEAFGAPTVLSPRDAERHRERARQLARKLFDGLQSRRDVLNITVDEVSLGDIIYDSYQRYYLLPTAEIRDPRLLESIEQVLAIYFASVEFLAQKEVAGLFTDHAVYWEAGVFTRVAIRHQVPVYHVFYNPATIVRVDPEMYFGAPGDPTGRAEGYGSCKLTLPYHLFRPLFALLPREVQEAGILRARANLQARLSGAFDPLVLPGGTAYHAPEAGSARLMAGGERPRILVMLHDFCDAPHAFRDHLFEDNYQWAQWLLERASRTNFDWYVKPHPNAAHDLEMGKKNAEVLLELQARFPKVTFLDPTVSNLQLIEEGVTAMFTGYGTAGHEFAYLGVPVVNAGDNPHISYEFNFHARSLAQLEAWVDGADGLKIDIDQRQIEEYAYMRYIDFIDPSFHPASILPPDYVGSPEAQKALGTPRGLRLAFAEPDAIEAKLRPYFREYFAKKKHLYAV